MTSARFDCGIKLGMYAQPADYRSYQPPSFSVHPQTGPWKVTSTNAVYSAITEDQCFVKEFERSVLATKSRPSIHVNTVKVRSVIQVVAASIRSQN